MMKRLIFKILSLCLPLLTISSCVGQLERKFPWEEDEEPAEEQQAEQDWSDAFLVLDFTATWCVNCPDMSDAIEKLKERRKVVPVCVHYLDEFDCEASRDLVSHFDISAFPVAIVGFCRKFNTSSSSVDILDGLCEKASSARCGEIHLETSLKDGICTIKADVKFAADGTFRLGMMLLEDGLTAPQTGRPDGYVHDNVLRCFLHQGVAGDNLGSQKEGGSISKEFSFETAKYNNLSSLKAVAYLVPDSEGPGAACASVAILPED